MRRSATPDPDAPCIIGVAQRTWRDGPAPEPLEQWAELAASAAADSGRADLLGRIDDVGVVHCASWAYDDPPGRLAERLGLPIGRRSASILAGTSHQRLVNAAAERVARGDSTVALVTGAEALATRKAAARAGSPLDWHHGRPDETRGLDLAAWFWPTELAHGVLPAWLTFALYDVARRASLGIDVATYRHEMGELLARASRVAAANPHAWFPLERTAGEIVTPGPANRIVAWPYTKLMTAYPDVDMASATVVTTHATADALGVDPARRVYLRGWAVARDAVHVAARAELHRSDAMIRASRAALDHAGLRVDDIALFDLYSCFPSSVAFAADALGLALDDRRGLTVTGGLASFGAPSSDYVGHAVATTVQRLRVEPGAAVVSGVGMHMTKHVWAVYANEPGPWGCSDERTLAPDRPDRPVVAEASGRATVATAAVVADPGRDPHAVAVCDLDDGPRCYALVRDPVTAAAMLDGEWVGRQGLVTPEGSVNVLSL